MCHYEWETALSRPPVHVSLVALPDGVISTLAGLYDMLNSLPALARFDPAVPAAPVFETEIVGATSRPVMLKSGLPVPVHRGVGEVERTDIVIVPSVMLAEEGWRVGRHPELVEWLRRMHDRGATLCSACSGVFLLAETGLYENVQTTLHWAFAPEFRRAFPGVPIAPDKVLVAAGPEQRLISSGASTSWHDLALYLVARHAGTAVALAAARFFALEWHRDGLAPYVAFVPPSGHGDGVIQDCQDWLAEHFSVASPVEELARRSGLPARTFKRRFAKATGLAPLAYVQRLRIDGAKRRLEASDAAIDEIGWQVGYEDPAFFRRLFKRLAGLTPGAYRRKFRLPDGPARYD